MFSLYPQIIVVDETHLKDGHKAKQIMRENPPYLGAMELEIEAALGLRFWLGKEHY